MGKIVTDGQKMTLQNSSRRCYSSMCDLTWRTCWVVCRSLGWSLVSTVALLVLSWCCCTMPKRSPAKRDFRDNGERKIKKSKEGASSSTSNVDEDLVRSFFCFLLWHKLIWFLVQHNLTSLDFLEWKKRLIRVEANIFIILLRWSSLKREHVLFSMIEGKLPRHIWHEALLRLICRFPGLPQCTNLWTFSLFRTFCFSTFYCVDFFVSSVLRHLRV